MTTVVQVGDDRFASRARALFYSRLAFLAIGLLALVVPAWTRALGLRLPASAYVYLLILAYHVGSYLAIGRRYEKTVTFVGLCADILLLIYLTAASGGLRSPLMPTQLVFTLFFALLFPSPLAILPPLLTLPVVAKLEQLLGTHLGAGDLMLVLWYSALNCMVVWAVVYLETRERASLREVLALQRERRRALVAEERARLAREIHDGLGATLSGAAAAGRVPRDPGAGGLADGPGPAGAARRRRRGHGRAAARGVDDARRLRPRPGAGGLRAQFGARHRIDSALRDLRRRAHARPGDAALLLPRAQGGAHQRRPPCRRAQRQRRPRLRARRAGAAGRGRRPWIRRRPGDRPGHYGLRNMRERAERLGGTLELDERRGAGDRRSRYGCRSGATREVARIRPEMASTTGSGQPVCRTTSAIRVRICCSASAGRSSPAVKMAKRTTSSSPWSNASIGSEAAAARRSRM